MQAEKGVHRLVRLSPFDSAHRRHTASRRLEVAPLVPTTTSTSRSTRATCASTPTAAQGAGGQHVNKTDSRRADHAPADRDSSSSARTSARRCRTGAVAMRVLKSRLLEREIAKREAELAARAGRGAGHRLRKSNPLVRPAPVHDGQRPPDEPQGRGTPSAVLDGDLDPFIRAYLLARAAKKV